jgi:CheY-like chemotaxis protein
MQEISSLSSLDWRYLLVWTLAGLISGGAIVALINALFSRRKVRVDSDKTEAEGEESKARAQKTAGETFHQLLEDLTIANERLQDQRNKNNELRDERDKHKALLENCERKERRRLAQEAQRFRVLLVEDQDEMRELVAAKFRNAPFKMDVARDGPDALEQYSDAIHLGFPFKLLILDYSMPGMSGIEVGRKIRSTGDLTTKFILWTAYPKHTLDDDLTGLFAEKERVVSKQTIAELEYEIIDALGLKS